MARTTMTKGLRNEPTAGGPMPLNGFAPENADLTNIATGTASILGDVRRALEGVRQQIVPQPLCEEKGSMFSGGLEGVLIQCKDEAVALMGLASWLADRIGGGQS